MKDYHTQSLQADLVTSHICFGRPRLRRFVPRVEFIRCRRTPIRLGTSFSCRQVGAYFVHLDDASTALLTIRPDDTNFVHSEAFVVRLGSASWQEVPQGPLAPHFIKVTRQTRGGRSAKGHLVLAIHDWGQAWCWHNLAGGIPTSDFHSSCRRPRDLRIASNSVTFLS